MERQAPTEVKWISFAHDDQLLVICGVENTLEVFWVSRTGDLVDSQSPSRVVKNDGTVIGVSPRHPIFATRQPSEVVQLHNLLEECVLQEFVDCTGLGFAPRELGNIFRSPRGSQSTVWEFRPISKPVEEGDTAGAPYSMPPTGPRGRFVEIGWTQGPFISSTVCPHYV